MQHCAVWIRAATNTSFIIPAWLVLEIFIDAQEFKKSDSQINCIYIF